MIEKIIINNIEYGIVIRSDENPDNTKFYSDKKSDLQIGLVCHGKGYTEPAHIHKACEKNILSVDEVLYVIKGKARINFFDYDGTKVGDTIIEEGDGIWLKGCTGHNLETLEDFKGFKAKQGPYVSMKEDKIFL